MGDNPAALCAGHHPETKPINIEKAKIKPINHKGAINKEIESPPKFLENKLIIKFKK